MKWKGKLRRNTRKNGGRRNKRKAVDQELSGKDPLRKMRTWNPMLTSDQGRI